MMQFSTKKMSGFEIVMISTEFIHLPTFYSDINFILTHTHLIFSIFSSFSNQLILCHVRLQATKFTEFRIIVQSFHSQCLLFKAMCFLLYLGPHVIGICQSLPFCSVFVVFFFLVCFKKKLQYCIFRVRRRCAPCA